MPELISTARCTAYRAVEEKSGVIVAGRELTTRIGYLLDLVQDAATAVMTEHWNPEDLNLLAGGKGPDGRALPSNGYMTLRRLGWIAAFPDGVYASDRVRRCAEEETARALRLALHRRGILQAVLATWPGNSRTRTDAEWAALRALLPDQSTTAEIRNRTRQIQAILDAGDALPTCFTEVEEPPVNAPQVLLAAADRQLVTLTRTGQRAAELRVQLPMTASPASRTGWTWHVIALALPPTVPAEAKLSTPTLRIDNGRNNGRICVDLPFAVVVPFAPAVGHLIAVGFDWGLNTLLTGTVGHLSAQGRVDSDGRALTYDATSVSAKLYRLRGHREDLADKRDHYAKLLTGLTGVTGSRSAPR